MSNQAKSKHLINEIDNSVQDVLLGLVSYNDNIILVQDCDSVVRKDFKNYVNEGKVILICGGGAGHEPAEAGFVGKGLLTGSISGKIFAAPPAGKILKLIKTIAKRDKSNQVLLIVPNYTGDRLNFGLACEKAKLEGYKVETHVFGDDCTFYGEEKRVGRRGLVGIVLVHKIAGALTEEGKSLEQIKQVLLQVDKSIGTISISLSECNIPGLGSSFSLGQDEMELGLGLHGEAGFTRLKVPSAKKGVELMLNQLLGKDSYLDRHFKDNDNRKIAVMVNNLGGLSQFELNIVSKEVILQVEQLGFSIERYYCGTFKTSFDMSGVSITILGVDEKILKLLDAPCQSPGWTQQFTPTFKINHSELLVRTTNSVKDSIDYSFDNLKFGRELFLNAVKLSCEKLIINESYLNELDRETGDGDTGSTLCTSARHILELINDKKLQPSFLQLANVMESTMCGTSGAIYSLMFTSASSYLHKVLLTANFHSINYVEIWTELLKYCMDTITKYSFAQPGDRSMLDALYAAYHSLRSNLNRDLSYSEIALEMANRSFEGAENTTKMTPKVGRASYVNTMRLVKPDAGAVAVSIWMNAIAETIKAANS